MVLDLALLDKWYWRMHIEWRSLWYKVLVVRYGRMGRKEVELRWEGGWGQVRGNI